MTRKLDLSARQVTAICKGAAKAGFVAEILIGGIVVRLVPQGDRTDVETAQQPSGLEVDVPPPPGPDLNYRETIVLNALVQAKGSALPAGGIPHAGPHTVNSLVHKGLVEIVGGGKFDRTKDDLRPTEAGRSHLDARTRYHRAHFRL